MLTINKKVFNSNKEESLKIYIKAKYLKQNKMHPFYIQCYSLPNLIYRYETTGVFNLCAFLYDSSIKKQETLNTIEGNIDLNNSAYK